MKKIIFVVLSFFNIGWAMAAVNINSATAEELKALPGIGAAKAAAIVEYRQQNGNFKTVDDLKNVKGIGDSIVNRLRDEATVGAATSAGKKAVPAIKNK
ncbi:topoisomerase [Neisseria arctica]|uniref:Topoisomerase n=1 Tax=Neisseria arctica TaxID=1470200 RepID=A0A0J0YSA5_9NEIS|nr:ComEA family DNA-binding protein [Neisseria arctica]KLT72987.1 topoisomerase [Neisseria arctica]UOO86488.1 ComEA family DNA-binding protein [Neisseria arctica]